MKYVPIPERLRTQRPSPLPALIVVIAIFALLGWVQNDDQAALERDRATLQQLAREAAGFGCPPLPESLTTTQTATGEKP